MVFSLALFRAISLRKPVCLQRGVTLVWAGVSLGQSAGVFSGFSGYSSLLVRSPRPLGGIITTTPSTKYSAAAEYFYMKYSESTFCILRPASSPLCPNRVLHKIIISISW